MGLHAMLAPAKSWMTVTLQSHSEVALKMLLREKSFHEAEHLVVYFVGTEMARGLDSHCLMGSDSWGYPFGQGLGKNKIEKLVTGCLEGRYVDKPLGQNPKYESYHAHINAHQRAYIAEEALNN